MPSGAKKRKAAKKKKAQAAHRINTSTNHGNDDQRSQDERESDDGVYSQASHDDDNHQNHFIEGNRKSGESDPSHHQSLVTDEESVEEVSGKTNITQKDGFADKDAIKVEKGFKPEENIEIIDSSFEHKKSSSSSSSSSKSSSDDESQEIEMSHEKGMDHSAIEVTAQSDAGKHGYYLPKQAVLVSADTPFPAPHANMTLEITAATDSAKSVEPKSEEQIHIDRISEETFVVSALDAVISNEDNGKSFPNLNENTKEFSASDENVGSSSGATNFEVKENERKILSLSNPVPEPKYVPKDVKESEVPVSPEKESPSQARHPVVQRTSWLSCCGLFDMITGSNR